MINKILNEVIKTTNISLEHMKSVSVSRDIVRARALFYVICHNVGISCPVMAVALGKTKPSVLGTISRYEHVYKIDADFRSQAEWIIKVMGIEEEISFDPIWDENFCIVDFSSRYAGKCFVGMVNGEPRMTSKYYCEVVNRMLELKK